MDIDTAAHMGNVCYNTSMESLCVESVIPKTYFYNLYINYLTKSINYICYYSSVMLVEYYVSVCFDECGDCDYFIPMDKIGYVRGCHFSQKALLC